MYGEYHTLSRIRLLLLIYEKAHFTHLIEEVAGPRDIYQAVLSHISERCLANLRVSSSITTGHCVLNKDVNPKRLGSEYMP